MKSKSYTCRYAGRYLIPIIQPHQTVECLLVYIVKHPSNFTVNRIHISDGFCEKGLIAYPNSTYLETRNLTGETTLKLGPNILLT